MADTDNVSGIKTLIQQAKKLEKQRGHDESLAIHTAMAILPSWPSRVHGLIRMLLCFGLCQAASGGCLPGVEIVDKKCSTELAYGFKDCASTQTTHQAQEKYVEQQSRRSQGRDYPQQTMALDDFTYFEDIVKYFHSGNDLTSLKSRPALELGARSGWGTQKLRERGWGNVLGLELSPKAVAFAKAQGRPVVRGDMHSLTQENCSQGFVFSRHSLEHSLDFRKVISEVHRVMGPESYAMFIIPIEPNRHHSLHTQPFHNDITLIHSLIEHGFLVTTLEVMMTRMGPDIKTRRMDMSDFRMNAYEQRVIVYKPSC